MSELTLGLLRDERAKKAEAERDEALAHLKNLLAIIHRDGGHYAEQHGLKKSAQSAHLVWVDLITKAEQADEALAQVAVLVEKGTALVKDTCSYCREGWKFDATGIYHLEPNSDRSVGCHARALKDLLSNLPAAAKELLEDRVRLEMVRGLYREAGQLYESSREQNIYLREGLEEIAIYSQGHHGHQPVHELVQSLTVDIPERCNVALNQKPSDAKSESK